jgi:hypothetical protein
MKKLLFVLALLTVNVQAQTQGITTCDGEYALCAASTCKPVLNKDGTPKTITGNNGVHILKLNAVAPYSRVVPLLIPQLAT